MSELDDITRGRIAANLLAGLSVGEIASVVSLPVDDILPEIVEVITTWQEGILSYDDQIDARRLNRAINAIWQKVQKVDLDAIETLIKIISQRQRLSLDRGAFPASPEVPGQVESRKAYGQLKEVALHVEWWEDYLALRAEVDKENNARWDWRKAVYIAWASMPDSKKWPRTQIELAQGILGLRSDRTIRQWRAKDPDIDEKIAEFSGAHILFRYRSAVFSALGDVAQMVDPRAHSDRKLFLEITGDYMPRQGVEHSGPEGGPIEQKANFDDWTDEEIDQHIANIQALFSAIANDQDAEADQVAGGSTDVDDDEPEAA